MYNIEQEVMRFARKVSSAEHNIEIAYVVTGSELMELNRLIEPKIRQNEIERNASMDAASRYVVGNKL